MADPRVQPEIMSKTALSEGYRETEIGPLPEEWEVVGLEEVATFVMGQSPSSDTYNVSGSGLPFLQGKAEFGDVYPQPVKWCSSPLKVSPEGAILVSVRAPVGDVNIAPYKCCIGRGLAAIQPTTKADTTYLFYCLGFHKNKFEEQSSGSTFKSINKAVLKNFLTPLPPLPEQKAIAHLLSTVQKALETTEQVIAASRELKRSLMNHLFTYGPVSVDEAEQVPLKETEIGSVPEHWDLVKLAKVVDMKYGYSTSIPKSPPPNGVKIISTAEILNEGRLDLSRVRTVEISEHLVDRYLIAKDDILFNWRNAQKHVGKAAIVEDSPTEPTISASFIIRIRTRESINNRYLHYLLTYLRQKGTFFNLSRRAVNQANFNANELGDLEISVPSLSVQRVVVDILLQVDRKIRVEEKGKQSLLTLFKTLLHNLMTAKVRIDNLDLSPVEEMV